MGQKIALLNGSKEKTYAFKCPGCKSSHHIPTEGPKAWGFNGDTSSPTFTPSVLAREYMGDEVILVCHSYVTNGRIQFLGDCTHELAGQTVDLPDVPESWL